MKKIILAVIIIIMAITAVGCGSTGGEAENINTAAIEEAVKNALNEQEYASTESGTENINTAAIKEAVKDALDEQEREKREKNSESSAAVAIAWLVCIIVVCIALVFVAIFG